MNDASSNAFLTPPETLKAPEAPTPVEGPTATDMVPLDPAVAAKIESQVDGFIAKLMTEDVHGPEFRTRLDSAFALGRSEISSAASLMGGAFLQRNFVGVEDSSAFKAINQMRVLLDDLNPGKQGDLFAQQKILGLIPFGNRLQAYFRKFESAGSQLQKAMAQLYAAGDDMRRDAKDIELAKGSFWESMTRLKGAIVFAQLLDERLHAQVQSLKAPQPERARALEQEVLFYARQNLMDMQTQMAVTVNGYLAMEMLKKTAREMVNGCERVATTGMSALAIAQTVARATGNQIAVMDMLNGASATIGDLVAQTGRQLGEHVQKTGDFAANPMMGVQRLQEMFDETFKAVDAMDAFRSKAIDTMGQTNAMLKTQLQRAETYVDRNRAALARSTAADASIAGPVAL
jgi:uncharacterized protein YaaN involved in tellurite resistance